MPDIINEYQKWKQQGEDLRVQAKHAMEIRFRDLLTEAVHIAEEYRADFGAVLKPPPAVTAFRHKASARPKAKPAGKDNPRRGSQTRCAQTRAARRQAQSQGGHTPEASRYRQKETRRRQGRRRAHARLRRQGLRDRRRAASRITSVTMAQKLLPNAT